eukprot:TRINITY_DN4874_c0_g4_i1.p2 TRINITY_DN4874_c0_g4~~TRINITY_DN4874_c0_g4_i1.p2  ORF type:complete len:285 (+),score=65.15 TRINITY_DN4874_c0_g4_i1:775-1629(+)
MKELREQEKELSRLYDEQVELKRKYKDLIIRNEEMEEVLRQSEDKIEEKNNTITELKNEVNRQSFNILRPNSFCIGKIAEREQLIDDPVMTRGSVRLLPVEYTTEEQRQIMKEMLECESESSAKVFNDLAKAFIEESSQEEAKSGWKNGRQSLKFSSASVISIKLKGTYNEIIKKDKEVLVKPVVIDEELQTDANRFLIEREIQTLHAIHHDSSTQTEKKSKATAVETQTEPLIESELPVEQMAAKDLDEYVDIKSPLEIFFHHVLHSNVVGCSKHQKPLPRLR